MCLEALHLHFIVTLAVARTVSEMTFSSCFDNYVP